MPPSFQMIALHYVSTLLYQVVVVVATWTNPVRNPGGSDPFVTYAGGYYYLLTTSWTDVRIARSDTVGGLKSGPSEKTVYNSTEADRCCNVWAPEVHLFDGTWYLYFVAGPNNTYDDQHVHVMQGGATPWDDYTYVRQMTAGWAIDPSVVRFASWGDYLMTSCYNGDEDQCVCLQQLGADRTSVAGDLAVISAPTEDWERSGNPVQEGPAALYFGGSTYISYAASYCETADYCIGLLTWDNSTDPSTPSAWNKSDGCVFGPSGNGNYGTAHNAFFESPDGDQTWLVYHATSSSAGACDDSRYTMIQQIGTASDGGPSFGSPDSSHKRESEPAS